MIKATLKHLPHKGPRTQTEKIELPDDYNTGDIIYAITKAIKKKFGYYYFNYKRFDGKDCIDREISEIALEDGTVYYCYEVVPDKYRLYIYYIDGEGEEYYSVADFRL